MQIPLITNRAFLFSTSNLFICSLDIKEGLTFLVKFENQEDLNEFSEICKKEDNVWIVYKDVVNKDDESSSDDDDDDEEEEEEVHNHL